MAYTRKQNTKTQTQTRERKPLVVTECKVTRVHRWDDGETFDLVLNGVTIYGCRFANGKNGTFVSFPARKGKDGKYYSYAYATLDEATVESIGRQVDELLDEPTDNN